MLSGFFNKMNTASFSSGSINVNGKTYVGGKSISIIGNKVYIDGKDQTPDAKEIAIKVVGNIEKLEVDYANSIIVEGQVGSVKSSSGDISIKGNVAGSIISSSGDVSCSNVGGDVNTSSGDISFKR